MAESIENFGLGDLDLEKLISDFSRDSDNIKVEQDILLGIPRKISTTDTSIKLNYDFKGNITIEATGYKPLTIDLKQSSLSVANDKGTLKINASIYDVNEGTTKIITPEITPDMMRQLIDVGTKTGVTQEMVQNAETFLQKSNLLTENQIATINGAATEAMSSEGSVPEEIEPKEKVQLKTEDGGLEPQGENLSDKGYPSSTDGYTPGPEEIEPKEKVQLETVDSGLDPTTIPESEPTPAATTSSDENLRDRGFPSSTDGSTSEAVPAATEKEYEIVGEEADKINNYDPQKDDDLPEDIKSIIRSVESGNYDDIDDILTIEVDPTQIAAELETLYPGYSEYLNYGELGDKNSQAAAEFQQQVETLTANMNSLTARFDNSDFEWTGDSVTEFQQLQQDYSDALSYLKEAVGEEKEAATLADYMAILSDDLNLIYIPEEIKVRIAKEKVEERLKNTQPTIEVTVKYKDGSEEKTKVDNPTYIALKNLYNKLNVKQEEWKDKIKKCIADMDYCKEKINDFNNRAADILKMVKKKGNNNGEHGGGPRKEIKYVDTTQEQMKYYQEMDTAALMSFANLLKSLADSKGVSLSEFLTNSKYAAMIRESLLKDSSLSQELRKALQNGDPAKTQALLKSIVFVETDEARAMFGFDRTTVTPIEDLIKISANSNDISEYIKNGKNVKNALSNIGTTSSYIGSLNSNNVTEQLMNVYNGDVNDDFSDTSFVVVRSFLDEVSEYRDTPVDNILSSNDYIQEPLVNLYKTTSYLSNIGNYSDEDASLIIANMLNNR